MRENEPPPDENKKEKIRTRYQGIHPDEIELIPATPQENFLEGHREKRVAVYARVSSGDPQQTSSFELQKNHYTDMVTRHEGWKLVEVYADEGISGTSLEHRDSFLKMMVDCEAGKIDLIVTKSVSRFARNVVDCVGCVQKLAALQPPVGVFFETENIYTLNSSSEMILTILSTVAQEESHNKSEIMNASIEMRFKRGIFLTPPLLGYDRDEDGNLVINEEEAKTVYMYPFPRPTEGGVFDKGGRKSVSDRRASLSVSRINARCGQGCPHSCRTEILLAIGKGRIPPAQVRLEGLGCEPCGLWRPQNPPCKVCGYLSSHTYDKL